MLMIITEIKGQNNLIRVIKKSKLQKVNLRNFIRSDTTYSASMTEALK
jgi:hypothetical protein